MSYKKKTAKKPKKQRKELAILALEPCYNAFAFLKVIGAYSFLFIFSKQNSERAVQAILIIIVFCGTGKEHNEMYLYTQRVALK